MRFSRFATAKSASATQRYLDRQYVTYIEKKVTSPLSPISGTKDELEKALNDLHFGNMFMNGVRKLAEDG